MMCIGYDDLKSRAQKALGVSSTNKAFVNLPSDMQTAIIELEIILLAVSTIAKMPQHFRMVSSLAVLVN